MLHGRPRRAMGGIAAFYGGARICVFGSSLCQHRRVFVDASSRWGSPRAARARARRGVGHLSAVITAVIAIFSGSGTRAATAVTVELAFEVEPDVRGCPDAEVFRANVRRQLGYDPFKTGSDRTVVVSIAHKPNGFNGRIQWNDASGRWAGERRLSSRKADCASLAQDLAFSIAVQVQLLATLAPVDAKPSAGEGAAVISAVPQPRKDGAAPPPAAASSLPAPPPPPPSVAAASDPSVSRPPSTAHDENAGSDAKASVETAPSLASQTQASGSGGVSVSAGLGPAIAWGLAPQSTLAGRLFVDARWPRLSFELAVDGAWPVTHEVAKVGGFKVDRTSGTLAGCGHAHVFVACVLGTVGVLRARGVGVDLPSSPTGAFFQLGARLGARFDLAGRAFVGGHVDGLWFPSPWTVAVNGVPMWTTPPLGALVGVDVGLIFF